MRKLVTPFLMVARLLVALQVVLGLCIWFGVATLTQIHIALGSLFVLDVWIIAVIALFALPRRGLPLLTMLMGGIIMWLGVAQRTMLVGSSHWVVQLAHLLLGVSAMGLVEPLAKATRIQLENR